MANAEHRETGDRRHRIAARRLARGAVCLLALLGCDTLPGDPPPGAAARPGFLAYTHYCARCHGEDGRSVRASRIAGKPVDLVDPVWRKKTSRRLVHRAIATGKGKMEGFGDRLSTAEIDSLADYVLWMPIRPGRAQSRQSPPSGEGP